MKIRDNPPVHLAYCLNIHPGETWAENFKAMQEKALAVRKLVCPSSSFALGLRLGNESATTLLQGDALAGLRRFLAANNLYVFTINGFPYGSFHGTRVKENVYKPDWRDRARLDYTIKLADVLKEILQPGAEGSISTVPGAYKQWITSEGDLQAMVVNLAECARYLASVNEETGKTICLALEPEPDCFLETTGEAIAFFENHLFRKGADYLAEEAGISRAKGEEILRRHLGICFDTCHISLQFEDLEKSLAQLNSAAIRVPKIQISSAISMSTGRDVIAKLGPFVDKVYLHQVKVRDRNGSVTSYNDLTPDVLEMVSAVKGGEVRAHFHVPLYFTGDGLPGSTSGTLTPEFFGMICETSSYLEIETYTYNVLPETLRARDVVLSIADEYGWVLSRIPPMTSCHDTIQRARQGYP